MNVMTGRTLLLDKPLLAITIALVIAFITIVLSSIYAGGYERKNIQLRKELSEIEALRGSVMDLKASVQSKENKMGRRQSAGMVSSLEQLLKSLGIQARAIKPLGTAKVEGYTEENAEIQIVGTDLNSIVNLLYKIDISPHPLKVKSATLKTTFEDPDKFVCTFTLSLMSK